MLKRVAVLALFAANLCVAPTGRAQAPAAASPQEPKAASSAPAEPALFKSSLGFTYAYPSDWEVMDSKPMMPAVQLKSGENADSDTEKHAIDCTRIELLIRHGTPKSVILVLVLPFECTGVSIKQSDLPAVATGVSAGLKKGFDIHNPVYGAYKLGTHDFWAERSHAISKNHPELDVTLETVCTITKTSLVCWMDMGRDEEAIRVFETGLASLEGDAPAALVPPGAFKPVAVLETTEKK